MGKGVPLGDNSTHSPQIYLSHTYLRHLVGAAHVYLRLLQRYCEQGRLRTVQKRQKRRRKQKAVRKVIDESKLVAGVWTQLL